MKKAELLKHLRDAINREESASTIYYEHINALSLKANIDESIGSEIKKTIALLIKENKKHKKICEELYEHVKKETRDDL